VTDVGGISRYSRTRLLSPVADGIGGIKSIAHHEYRERHRSHRNDDYNAFPIGKTASTYRICSFPVKPVSDIRNLPYRRAWHH